MKQYYVGGFVRDHIMGTRSNDIDFVVVGSTPEEMIINGFEQVGADFPVFLKNGVEYALARKEVKTGKGYHGFTSEFSPDVTLEEDLNRRDLTINSMAIEVFDDMKTRLLHIIDPYNGKKDIDDKIFRHTSNAFAEDPVRVLRLARFAARFGSDWRVATETVDLIKEMVTNGVLAELTPERVWKELSRALLEPFPRLFFDTLDYIGALEVLFPLIYKMKSVPESLKWHPEGNVYEHTMLVVTAAANLVKEMNPEKPLNLMFAALVHDFGKTATDPSNWPKHYDHENLGVPLVENFSDQLMVPSSAKRTAMVVTKYHMHMHKLNVMKPLTFIRMFDGMKAWNSPEIVEQLVFVGKADARGRLGSENDDVSSREFLMDVFMEAKNVKFDEAVVKSNKPVPLGIKAQEFMQDERTKAVIKMFKTRMAD